MLIARDIPAERLRDHGFTSTHGCPATRHHATATVFLIKTPARSSFSHGDVTTPDGHPFWITMKPDLHRLHPPASPTSSATSPAPPLELPATGAAGSSHSGSGNASYGWR